jgi:hypothetical protein
MTLSGCLQNTKLSIKEIGSPHERIKYLVKNPASRYFWNFQNFGSHSLHGQEIDKIPSTLLTRKSKEEAQSDRDSKRLEPFSNAFVVVTTYRTADHKEAMESHGGTRSPINDRPGDGISLIR